MDVNESIRQ